MVCPLPLHEGIDLKEFIMERFIMERFIMERFAHNFLFHDCIFSFGTLHCHTVVQH